MADKSELPVRDPAVPVVNGAGQISQLQSILAGGAYVLTSSCLILFNKHALSSFSFACPNALLFFHCLLSVALVKLCAWSGFLRQPLEPLKWSIIKLWFPVNLIFVGMLVSSFFGLKLIGVGKCQPALMRSAAVSHLL